MNNRKCRHCLYYRYLTYLAVLLPKGHYIPIVICALACVCARLDKQLAFALSRPVSLVSTEDLYISEYISTVFTSMHLDALCFHCDIFLFYGTCMHIIFLVECYINPGSVAQETVHAVSSSFQIDNSAITIDLSSSFT